MATEDDKTNTGVAGTAIAVGVAAMIAGSAALVGMARTELDEVSQDSQAYADLNSVKELKSQQSAKLTSAKVSIDKARQMTLSMLKGDPDQASPWTPSSIPPAVSTAGVGTDVAPSSGTEGTAPAPAATAPAGTGPTGTVDAQPAPAPSAAPSVAPAVPAPSAAGSN